MCLPKVILCQIQGNPIQYFSPILVNRHISTYSRKIFLGLTFLMLTSVSQASRSGQEWPQRPRTSFILGFRPLRTSWHSQPRSPEEDFSKEGLVSFLTLCFNNNKTLTNIFLSGLFTVYLQSIALKSVPQPLPLKVIFTLTKLHKLSSIT